MGPQSNGGSIVSCSPISSYESMEIGRNNENSPNNNACYMTEISEEESMGKRFSNELTRSLQQFKREDERNNEPWIHATYYEKLQKCDTFKGYENIIEIDNGTNGNQFSRFCLGTVTNIYADEEQLHYRNHIGKILLENKGQCTWITNCSNSSVFVQNTNYNKRNNLASNYVHKLKPADEIEVFDENYF